MIIPGLSKSDFMSRKSDYRKVFLETEAGRRVLRDLYGFCVRDVPRPVPDDNTRIRVWRRIDSFLHVDPVEIERQLKAKEASDDRFQ